MSPEEMVDNVYRTLVSNLTTGQIVRPGDWRVIALRDRIMAQLSRSTTMKQYMHHLDRGRIGYMRNRQQRRRK